MYNNEDSPASTSMAYNAMKERWDVINNVLAGTEAMRKAGEKFLPRHIAETSERYENRLNTAVFRNMTEDTLESLVGRPFSEPVKVQDTVPDDIQSFMDNIDNHGDNIDSFAKKWFKSSVAKGYCAVLVEFPRIKNGTEYVRTLADDRMEGVRPYLCRIEPENLICVRTETIAGKEVITHARICRYVEELEGRWGTRVVKEIMVLEPGTVEIFRQEDVEDSKSAWVVVDSWETGLSFVPMVTFYANYESTCLSKPPLLDLAYANIAHWQSSSDQRVILSTARLPILAVSGLSEEEASNIVVGPFKFLSSNNPDSKFYYVEHDGNAINAGAEDLRTLERWMSSYGAEFLKRDTGTQTATARALDSSEALSKLQAWVVDFENSMATALSYMKAWMTGGSDFKGGKVELVSDFDYGELDQTAVHAILAARTHNDISRKAFLAELQRRDILSDLYDVEEDEQYLDKEEVEYKEVEIPTPDIEIFGED